MTRDEYILRLLRENRALQKIVFFIFVGVSISAIVLLVIMFQSGDYKAIGVCIGYLAFGVLSAMSARSSHAAYDAAVKEVEADPVDVVHSYKYSKRTGTLIQKAQLTEKELFSAVVAYGIVAVVIDAAFIGMLYICANTRNPDAVWWVLGLTALAFAGGLFLTVLAIQAFRNWRTTKALNEANQ